MGLDIMSYSQIRLVGKAEGQLTVRIEKGFEAQADGLVPGEYDFSGESLGFKAGSYSSYNEFRSDLAALVGTTPVKVWTDLKPGPFFELINFPDDTGTIGPQTAAKLAKDFAEWQEKAGTIGYFAEKYALWRQAFELASDGGCVCFH